MRFSSQPDAVRPTVFAKPPAANAPRMINFTGIPEGMQGNQYYGEGLGGIDDQRAALAKAAGQGGAIGGLANVKEPLGGIGYMLGEFENAFGDYRARQAEAATRNALAQIMGGIDPTKGPTQQDIQAAMQADPAYGTKLYEQLVAMQNKEQWEPIPTPPGETGQWAKNSRNGELKKVGGSSEDGAVKMSDITALRQDYMSDPSYKNWSQASPIWSSISDAATRDTSQADLNIIIGMAKIFDPTSVVRTQEGEAVQQTAGLPTEIFSAWKYLSGQPGSRLDAYQPGMRKALLAEGYSRMQGYRAELDRHNKWISAIAERHGVNPADVVDLVPALGDDPNKPQEKPPEDTGDVEITEFTAPEGTPEGDVYTDPKDKSVWVNHGGKYVRQQKPNG